MFCRSFDLAASGINICELNIALTHHTHKHTHARIGVGQLYRERGVLPGPHCTLLCSPVLPVGHGSRPAGSGLIPVPDHGHCSQQCRIGTPLAACLYWHWYVQAIMHNAILHENRRIFNIQHFRHKQISITVWTDVVPLRKIPIAMTMLACELYASFPAHRCCRGDPAVI